MNMENIVALCWVGLRACFLSILAVVAFLGLLVIVGNSASESVTRLFIEVTVSLSLLAFVVHFLSTHMRALSNEMEKPLRRFVYTNGILTALVVQVVSGYSWAAQEFVFDLGVVITLELLLLSGMLLIHIRHSSFGHSLRNILFGVLVILVFMLLSFMILNSSRMMDSLEPGIVSLSIMTVQIIAYAVKFSMRSNFRYYFVLSVLMLMIVIYGAWWAYLFSIGGGF